MLEDSFTHCVKCGTEKNEGAECLKCGVIYEKAERVVLQEKKEQEKQQAWDEEKKRQRGNRRPPVIAFDYEDARGNKSSRQIKNPIRFSYAQLWYINGFCLTRQEARTFRFDRIQGSIVDVETGEVIAIDRIMEVDPPDNLSDDPREENTSSKLISCPTCKKPISRNAESCPLCGERIKKENPLRKSANNSPRKPLGCMGWAFILFFTLYLLGKCDHNNGQKTPIPPTPQERLTPQPEPQRPAPNRQETHTPRTIDFPSAFVIALNGLYGNVCHAELSGFFSKTLKIDWTNNTKKIHAIKVIAEVGDSKNKLYQDGVRYFQFPNDAGTYNLIDWKTGEMNSIPDRAVYYFKD